MKTKLLISSLLLLITSPLLAQIGPDLTVELEIRPDGPFRPNDTFTATVSVANADVEGAGPLEAGVDFAVDVIVFSDLYGTIIEQRLNFSGPLEIDNSVTQSTQLTIPLDVRPGAYTIYAQVDPDRSTGDIREANNFSQQRTFTVEGFPDLQITGLEFDGGEYEGGDPLPITLSWRNAEFNPRGLRNVSVFEDQRYRVTVVLSRNGEFGDEDDIELWWQDNEGSRLLPGGTETREWVQMLPGNAFGDYFVLARIDEFEAIEEVEDAEVPDDKLFNGNNTWGDAQTAKITLRRKTFPETSILSLDENDASGEGSSYAPAISRDGGVTAFTSLAPLAARDGDTQEDIYVRLVLGNSLQLITVSPEGGSANGPAIDPDITADGRYVVYTSSATNLANAGRNGFFDLYVYDRLSGANTRLTNTPQNTESNGDSFSPSISDSGRYVAFQTFATNFGFATEGQAQVVLLDRDSDGDEVYDEPGAVAYTLISASADGAPGNGTSEAPVISPDGSTVVFTSRAPNLHPSNPLASQVYRYTVATGALTLVSATPDGEPGNGASFDPALNGDGSVIAFASDATNLDPQQADTNELTDIFIADAAFDDLTRLLGREGEEPADLYASDLPIPGNLGLRQPHLSADGRYLVFRSEATNLLPASVTRSDGAVFENPFIHRYTDTNFVTDIYRFDRAAGRYQRVSVDSFGFAPLFIINTPVIPSSRDAVLSDDGRYVAFASDADGAPGLVKGPGTRTSVDTNQERDVFLHDTRLAVLPDPATAPTVFITAPTEGAVVSPGASVRLEAQASDSDGRVRSLQFFVDNEPVGEELTQEPFTVNWTPAVTGTYRIHAVATDNEGARGTSGTVTVIASLEGETTASIEIVRPEVGQRLAVGQTIDLVARTTNTVGSEVVQFLVNNEPVGEALTFPYLVQWTPTGEGQFFLQAVLLKDGQEVAVSDAVAVAVEETPIPRVRLASPGAGDTLTQGTTVSIHAVVENADSNAMLVEFEANGELIGIASEPPYAIDWVPESTGDYNLTANIYGVRQEPLAGSQAVPVTVVAAPTPTVRLVQPFLGDSFNLGEEVALVAAVSGSGNPLTVTYFANGVEIGATSFFPYRISWETSVVGTVELTARVEEANVGQATSAPVRVTVTPSSLPTPAILLASPRDGEFVQAGANVTLSAALVNPPGDPVVKFYANDAEIAEIRTFPFNFDWIPLGAGEFFIGATLFYEIIIEDERILVPVANASPVVVTSFNGIPPTVTLTSPVDGTAFRVGESFTLTATALDEDNGVSRVQFFRDGEIFDVDTTEPYSVPFTADVQGESQFTAVAEDLFGNRITSEPITLFFTASARPEVTITNPQEGDRLTLDEEAIFTVAVADPDSAIDRIEYLVDGELVGVADESPWSLAYTPGARGTRTLIAVAYDEDGDFRRSTPVDFNVTRSVPPQITLEAVPGEFGFVAAEPIQLQADVSDADGTIAEVIFKRGGVEIATLTSAPWSVPYVPPQGGEYVLTAEVTDNDGDVAVSNTVTLMVDASYVVLTEPGPGETFPVSGVINMAAEARDFNGTIRAVQFYQNGTLVSTDETFPYTATFSPVALGEYELYAIAIDNADNTTESSGLKVTVTGNDGPDVVLTAPAVGTELALGSTVFLSALAADVDGFVASLEFRVNGINLGLPQTERPFVGLWQPARTGTYAIEAVATDNLGNVAVATSEVTITAPVGALPTAFITLSPAPEDANDFPVFTTNSSVFFQVAVDDPDGTVERVRLYNERGTLLNDQNEAPFTTLVDFNRGGSLQYYALVTDDDGNTVLSSVFPLVVDSVALAPELQLTGTPQEDAASLSLDVDTSNGANVDFVEFYVDGLPIGRVEEPPYRLRHEPVRTGRYTYTAVAAHTFPVIVIDAGGEENEVDYQRVTSSNTVTLDLTVGDREAPVVSLIEPDADSTVTVRSTITLNAEAFDPDGVVTRVEFYQNGVFIAEDTDYPYIIGFSPNAVGSYAFSAVAIDNDGLSTDSDDVVVDVVANEPPLLAFTAPDRGSAFTLGSSVFLSVAAGDRDGSIAQVQFFANGNAVSPAITTPPYVFAWQPSLTGEYEIEAVALDNLGNRSRANTTVRIRPPIGQRPVAFLSGTPRVGEDEGRILTVGSSVYIDVVASDPDGIVTSVELFTSSGQSLGRMTEAPYTQLVTLLDEGNQSFFAIVEDFAGNVVVTNFLTIEVDGTNQPPQLDFAVEVQGGSAILSVNANTANGAEVNQMIFFANGNPIGSVDAPPYQFVYQAPESGEYTFTAISVHDFQVRVVLEVRDLFLDYSTTTVTDPVTATIVIPQNQLPTVALQAPRDGAMFSLGSSIPVEATARDPDGIIERVDFFANDGRVLSLEQGPFVGEFTPPSLGFYTIRAIAVDNAGAEARSEPVTVQVVEGTIPEIVNITLDARNNEALLGQPVRFDVTVQDEEPIVRVDLYRDGVLVATDTQAPWQIIYAPPQIGRATYYVEATNARGNVGRSNEISLLVRQPQPLTNPRDFVYQTFLDLTYALPSEVFIDAASLQIELGVLSPANYIVDVVTGGELTTTYEVNAFPLMREIFAAHWFMTDQWPRANRAYSDINGLRISNEFVFLIRELADTYVEQFNSGEPLVTLASSAEEKLAFFRRAWERKYGMPPTAAQENLAATYLGAVFDGDAFLASFVADIGNNPTPAGTFTPVLAFANPPNDRLYDWANTAALYTLLLRAVPSQAEVESLSALPLRNRVETILADPRFGQRFGSLFADSVKLDDYWRWSPWFGTYQEEFDPWLFHMELGWIFVDGFDEDGFWMFRDPLAWMFTAREVFPNVYSIQEETWLFFQRGKRAAGEPMLFFNYTSGEWLEVGN